MNVNFANQDERFIKSKVSQGYYSNATELVRDAVRKMREEDEKKEKLETLRALVMVGHKQATNGDIIAYTEGFAESAMRRAIENQQKGKSIKDEVKL